MGVFHFALGNNFLQRQNAIQILLVSVIFFDLKDRLARFFLNRGRNDPDEVFFAAGGSSHSNLFRS